MKDPRDSIASTNNNKKISDSERSAVGLDPVTGTERPFIYAGLQNKPASKKSQTEIDAMNKKTEDLFAKLDKEEAARVANILKANKEGGSLEGFNLSDSEKKSIDMLRRFPSYMSEYQEGDLTLPSFRGVLQGNPGRDVQAFKAAGDERFKDINPNAAQGLRGLSSIYREEGFELGKGSDLDKAIAKSIKDRSVYKK